MASMNTRLNIEKLDGNIVKKHGGSKQVGFKQLGLSAETRVHGSHDENVFGLRWNYKELKGIVNLRFFKLVTMILQWIKDGWRTSNLKRRQTRTAWSTQQCIKSGVAKHLGVAGIQQQNGLVDETNVTLFAKLTRDREQHLACELFGYREDSNDNSFAIAVVEKIYVHESPTFNNTVACEVISKWKAGLKDDMDARSESIRCAEIRVTKGLLVKAKENILGLEIIRDQSGDYDVEKNGKWSCIYAVESQEYQMVCTRLDIASTDVGMLDKFDRGL
uniref:Zinc finger, CCHC-type n=1 Tax=Tanacetum cinerariifolium TaxID=118510 RepID=A0A6L2KQD4_TANCI|nr:zinc finger, CCHC-type [Tanacetum cinerariifolium]